MRMPLAVANVPYFEENKRFEIQARGKFVGCVINPRNYKPYFAFLHDEELDLVVPSFKSTIIGVGTAYFDTDPKAESSLSARITKFPRIHCPFGVSESGTGLGSALYFAMAIAAPYTRGSDVVAAGGRGISSDSETSQQNANAVWKRLVEKGLAKAKEVEFDEVQRTIYTMTTEDAEEASFVFDKNDQTSNKSLLSKLDLSEVDSSVLPTFKSILQNQ